MHLKKYNLKNKVALVTGAGKGLGKACAIALAEAGANLIITGRTIGALEELDDKIIEMLNTDQPVIFDCLVDKQENCFPMIPSGKPHNQMLLGPKDQEEKKITGKGRTLV